VATNRLTSIAQKVQMKGFSDTWCWWIECFTQNGHVGIKIHDYVGDNFQTHKGLRQGDPLSPILFNIVVDMWAILINQAKGNGQTNGIVPHLVDNGLSIHQYADDTIIFMDGDLEKAKKLKLLLCAFEQLFGLKINFHKSDVFYFGDAKISENVYSQLFGCQIGTYPFKYLGIPMHYKNSTIVTGKK
jgi:hypothetical protein